MPKRGRYIVIEGNDGTGKTTQVELLVDYLHSKNVAAEATKEPGNTPISERIRDVLVDKTLDRQPLTNVLLYTASRVESWRLVEAKLKQGVWIVSSRNYYSTLIYQGYGEGVDLDLIQDLTTKIMGKNYTHPDDSIILATDHDQRLDRLKRRTGNQLDYFESKDQSFHDHLDRGYTELAAKLNLPIVDASHSPEKVHQQIIKLLEI